MGVGTDGGFLLSCLSSEKRSQALLGSNLARDIRADGAPRVHLALGSIRRQGLFFCDSWTPEPCLKKSIVQAAWQITSYETIRFPRMNLFWALLVVVPT